MFVIWIFDFIFSTNNLFSSLFVSSIIRYFVRSSCISITIFIGLISINVSYAYIIMYISSWADSSSRYYSSFIVIFYVWLFWSFALLLESICFTISNVYYEHFDCTYLSAVPTLLLSISSLNLLLLSSPSPLSKSNPAPNPLVDKSSTSWKVPLD